MGQYYKGRKIGTCESMYYMRLSEAQELAKQGARDDDDIPFADYLKDNTTRWRFPFPDEDQGIPADCQFDKCFDLPAGGLELHHGEICVHNTNAGGGYGVNIFIPCPHSKEFKDKGLRMSQGGAGEQFLSVRYQTIEDGEEKTIFTCPRCGKAQTATSEELEKIKERAREYFECYNTKGKSELYQGNQRLYDHAMEILNRIK